MMGSRLTVVAACLLLALPWASGAVPLPEDEPAVAGEATLPFPGFSGDDNPQSRALAQVALGYEAERVEFLLGADLDYQSHMASLQVPLEMRLGLLEAILEAEPDIVRVTPSCEPWMPAFWDDLAPLREYMDAVVEGIRASGARLMIADGAAEQYWEDPMGWESFRSAFIDRVREMAGRYEPDYYVVVKEPAWYGGLQWGDAGGMLTEAPRVDDWLELTRAACEAVKEASPGTVTMVSVIPGDPPGGQYYPESREYFRAAHWITALDAVGTDLYRVADLYRFDVMLAELGGLPEKPHWILETWDGNPDEQSAEWRIRSHADWLALMARYASFHQLSGVVAFYSRCFCYVGSQKPGSVEEWKLWLDERTPAFQVFRQMKVSDPSTGGWAILLLFPALVTPLLGGFPRQPDATSRRA